MYVFILSRLICLFIHLLFIFVSIFSRRWANKFLETSNFNGKKKSFSLILWTSRKFFLISKTSNRGGHFPFLLASWSSFFLLTQMLECALNMNATELVVAKLAWLITRRLFWLVVLCLTSQLFCYNHDLGLCTFDTLSLLSRRLYALIERLRFTFTAYGKRQTSVENFSE